MKRQKRTLKNTLKLLRYWGMIAVMSAILSVAWLCDVAGANMSWAG